MKTYLYPLSGLLCLVLLSGCNEKMQEIKQRSIERQQIEKLAHEARMHERELQNRLALAAGAGRLELKKQEQFHAVMKPLAQFSVIVLTLGGLVFFFRFLKYAHDENTANRQVQLRTVQEAEKTARHKYELACTLVLKPEFFEMLSDEHRTQALERLEGPPRDEPQQPPRPPLHERMYDDLKGWASRKRA